MTLTFFGLQNNFQENLFDQIFYLINYSNGISFSEAMDMPINLRKHFLKLATKWFKENIEFSKNLTKAGGSMKCPFVGRK